MTSSSNWQPFGFPADAWDDVPEGDGTKCIKLSLRRPRGQAGQGDRAAKWLRNAMLGLSALAATAAVVSFEAQFVMVRAVKHGALVAALEAGIPDAAALVFASLGIALALYGKRAIRARVLNVGAVG